MLGYYQLLLLEDVHGNGTVALVLTGEVDPELVLCPERQHDLIARPLCPLCRGCLAHDVLRHAINAKDLRRQLLKAVVAPERLERGALRELALRGRWRRGSSRGGGRRVVAHVVGHSSSTLAEASQGEKDAVVLSVEMVQVDYRRATGWCVVGAAAGRDAG